MIPNIRTNFCPNCEAQANTIEELRAANERWVIAFNQAKADATGRIEALQADNARLREAVKEIKDAWDWWQVDTYDRCASVVDDAISAALGETK
jgi:hypothetical protein